MALKDWKKIGKKLHWVNKHEDEYEVRIINNRVFLLEPVNRPNLLSKWKEIKNFKNKNEAIKYARDYMRKQ